MKWALSSVYLSQTMWNHTKNLMKRLKRPPSVILTRQRQELCAGNAKKTQKLGKLKRKLLKILKRYDLSRGVPCERARPEHSENVVVFEIWRF